MAEIIIRDASSGDAEGVARISLDSGAYYERLAPDRFQTPDVDGLVEFMEADSEWREQPTNRALVAEVNGEVAGYLEASIQEPLDSARWQTQRDLAERRVSINYVATANRFRRLGVATRLVEAAEEWGRSLGATIVVCDTFIDSPLAVPFWEQRMDYARQAIIFRKRLNGPGTDGKP